MFPGMPLRESLATTCLSYIAELLMYENGCMASDTL